MADSSDVHPQVPAPAVPGGPTPASSGTDPTRPRASSRILVLGGGSVGLNTARALRRYARPDEATIAVVDPRPYMTYAPFLPEVAAGSIDPRYVVAPHHRALRGIDSLRGHVSQVRHAEKKVQVTPDEGGPYWVSYDLLVVGLGSVSRALPIPGLAAHAIGFKNVEEAIALRNHVLDRIDQASSTWDRAARSRMLTFVFVGGGFAGVEALAETEDMARAAVAQYDSVGDDEPRFVLVEGTNRILPEVTAELAGYTLDQLGRRRIEIRLGTFLSSCVDGHVVLSDGSEFDAETVVWTAGVKANPVLAASDLPLDKAGRVTCDEYLRVVGPDGQVVPDVFAAGDCAAVPDLAHPGSTCPPNAQHAVRQGKHLGDTLARVLHSADLRPYRHVNVGTVASLGMYQGVAYMFGRFKVRGPLAWVLHRSYHLYAMPTMSRRLRIATGWTLNLFTRREVVPLGSLHDPRAEFRAAAQAPRASSAS